MPISQDLFGTQKGTRSYQRHLPDIHEMVLTDSDESEWILDGFQARFLKRLCLKYFFRRLTTVILRS